MSYSWYRVDAAFVQHPKTLALQAALNEPLADAYINRLWSWVHRYAPTGLIPSRVTTQIEAALGWRGVAGRLLEACTEVGLLDVVSDGLEVHDWAEYQAFWAGKAKKEKAKKRKRKSRSVTQSVTHLSRVTAPSTRQDKTRQTEHNKTEDQGPLPGLLKNAESDDDPDQLAAAWNELKPAASPVCATLTKTRRIAAKARLKDAPGVERWRAAITRIGKSAFLTGQNDRGWVANFDWLLRPDTLTKLEEGAYEQRGRPPTKGSDGTTQADWDNQTMSFEEALSAHTRR